MVEESLDTKQLSEILHVKPSTIRRSLCMNGNYLSLRPIKVPNGKTLWPGKEAKKIVNGEVGR